MTKLARKSVKKNPTPEQQLATAIRELKQACTDYEKHLENVILKNVTALEKKLSKQPTSNTNIEIETALKLIRDNIKNPNKILTTISQPLQQLKDKEVGLIMLTTYGLKDVSDLHQGLRLNITAVTRIGAFKHDFEEKFKFSLANNNKSKPDHSTAGQRFLKNVMRVLKHLSLAAVTFGYHAYSRGKQFHSPYFWKTHTDVFITKAKAHSKRFVK